MIYKIYLIEDKQKLKYVGSTKETLRRRLQRHRNKKIQMINSNAHQDI